MDPNPNLVHDVLLVDRVRGRGRVWGRGRVRGRGGVHLVHDVLLVDLLEYVGADDGVLVRGRARVRVRIRG